MVKLILKTEYVIKTWYFETENYLKNRKKNSNII